MILLGGIPSEIPLAMVNKELDKLSVPHIMFNQRDFANTELSFEISNGIVRGMIQLKDREYRLEDIRGVYLRLMDDQRLPELHEELPDSNKRRYCRALHDALIRWCEVTPARVINRMAAMSSNSSKPYQAQRIREHGFPIPETLITNDQDLVRDFQSKHKRIIYKSISGVRSIVQVLENGDLDRLDRIRWCPVQFQQFIEGTNLRVHVIGTSVFSTIVNSDVTDYRYAHQQGSDAELKAVSLPEEFEQRCVELSRSLGLEFSGIDFKITPTNDVFCFEVNPSPAFSYYEANTGQPIARTVARYLAGLV